jgi:hypothetical protein
MKSPRISARARSRLRTVAAAGAVRRLGLGVLQHRGVAAWLGVRTAMASVRPTPTRPLPPATAGGVATELVGLLASMALAVAARG